MIFSEVKHRSSTQEAGGNELVDYDVYTMSSKEKILYISLAAAGLFAVVYIFYHSIIFSVLACPLAFLYPRMRVRDIVKKRKNQLNLQFKDMLYSLSSSLVSGKSVESAFRDVLKDLSIIYPDPSTYIIVEVGCIVRKIEMNETIESALYNFAGRSHLEDIENFADVFHTCKRTGGNIVEVIKNTSNIINEKIEIRQEIETILAQRRLERKILSVLPVVIILILTFSSGDYIAPVFDTIPGRVAMTFAIVLLGIAYFISKKIMDIKV